MHRKKEIIFKSNSNLLQATSTKGQSKPFIEGTEFLTQQLDTYQNGMPVFIPHDGAVTAGRIWKIGDIYFVAASDPAQLPIPLSSQSTVLCKPKELHIPL